MSISIYIMSDIHGIYDKYITMLKEINFNDKDELYILGDIFDRGDKPLEILEHIVKHKNIHLLIGNHEDMFIEAYENDFRDLQLWFMNGGANTYYALCDKGNKYMEEAYKYIKKLPLHYTLSYGNFTYLLCHAGVKVPSKKHGLFCPDLIDILNNNCRDDYLWSRDHCETENMFEDINIICGHTPTQTIKTVDPTTGALSYSEPKIVQKGSFIYIDCGACFDGGKLGCIELKETGYKSYYV